MNDKRLTGYLSGVKLVTFFRTNQKLKKSVVMRWEPELGAFTLSTNKKTIKLSSAQALVMANRSGFKILDLKNNGRLGRVDANIYTEVMQ